MQWILTGMLIVVSAATAAFTGYLVRRLFTLDPGVPDAPMSTAPGPPAPSSIAQGGSA